MRKRTAMAKASLRVCTDSEYSLETSLPPDTKLNVDEDLDQF